MKNFKAKEWLEKENLIDYSIKMDDICYCCKEKKTTPRIPIYIDEHGEDIYEYGEVDYKWVCLDCLQYTETQERIEQLESGLYPEDKEFENND